jgi:hypothetical protein
MEQKMDNLNLNEIELGTNLLNQSIEEEEEEEVSISKVND